MASKRPHVSAKAIGAFLILLFCVFPVKAQFLRTSYFMEDTHYRQQLNPALLPNQGYFNIPVLGAVSATVGSTSLGYQDIIDIIDDSGNFYSNPNFLKRLKDRNNLNVNFSTEILSAGWYKGKNFWSFNVGVRTDIGASLTRSMFTFLNEMDELDDRWRNSNYDISGQKMDINAYGEIGLGYARQINSRLTIGGKVKFLLGIGNMKMKIDNVLMNANIPSDTRITELENMHFSNNPDEAAQQIQALQTEIGNYYAHLAVDASLESSFKGLDLVQEEGQNYISDFKFRSKDLGIAGYGFGIDLGASYKIMDNLTVSASVLDLGFISWTKGSTKIASANPTPVDIVGSDYLNGVDPNDAQGSADAIKTNINRLQDDASTYMNRVNGGEVLDYEMLQLQVDESGKSRQSKLASTIVVGAEYGFLNNKLGVGVLSTTRFVQPRTLTELTFSANYRPKHAVNVALSYSVIQSAGKSFGLALKLGPVFLGTDYMFLGKNSNSVSGFVGISVPLGKRKVNNNG